MGGCAVLGTPVPMPVSIEDIAYHICQNSAAILIPRIFIALPYCLSKWGISRTTQTGRTAAASKVMRPASAPEAAVAGSSMLFSRRDRASLPFLESTLAGVMLSPEPMPRVASPHVGNPRVGGPQQGRDTNPRLCPVMHRYPIPISGDRAV